MGLLSSLFGPSKPLTKAEYDKLIAKQEKEVASTAAWLARETHPDNKRHLKSALAIQKGRLAALKAERRSAPN